MCRVPKGGFWKHPLAWPLGPGPPAVPARPPAGPRPHPSPRLGTWVSSFAENTGRLWLLGVLPRSRFSQDARMSARGVFGPTRWHLGDRP